MNPFLELTDYEAANLVAGLQTLRRLKLDTGDWLGQLLHRIAPTDCRPNVAPEDQVARVYPPDPPKGSARLCARR